MIEAEQVDAVADRMQYAMVPLARGSGLAVGIDVVHLPTFEHELDAGGVRMLEKLFTAAELDFCAGRVERLGARMAAKEAALKALGTGMRGIRCPEVEVLSLASGQPRLHLHGAAKRRAARLGLHRFRLSLCHEGELALATVVADGCHA
jgi:holo-[acyl-carrier protein] synthase